MPRLHKGAYAFILADFGQSYELLQWNTFMQSICYVGIVLIIES